MTNYKIFFVSLGCDKNLVDTEVMLGKIRDAGYEIINDEEEADVIIVNTCSFIHDAKEESVQAILEMGTYKDHGNLKGLIAVGCLTQRYQQVLLEEIPELDGVLGTSNYDEIVQAIDQIMERNEPYISFKDINYACEPYIKRVGDQTSHYAYLKISEGCNNNCTYCIIPSLRGRVRSRTIESLVEETEYLVSQGKSEIILVAQDVTKYGIDLYKEKALPRLLRELVKVDGAEWIRLLYCYPEDITDELIDVMASEDKIVNYIDIPIQHISNSILRGMARRSNDQTIKGVIEKLRMAMPDIAIRSSLIVGFPGETDEDFGELADFVSEYRLERVGAFTYSLEEGTKAAEMPGQIPQETMDIRRDELMAIQQEVSLSKNSEMVGRHLTCIIEGYMTDENVYIGRTYRDAPGVDGTIFIESDYNLLAGQFVPVVVTDYNEYDLVGTVDDEADTADEAISTEEGEIDDESGE